MNNNITVVKPSDEEGKWAEERVFWGLTLEVKAGDIPRIKEYLNDQQGLKICHSRTSAFYLYITAKRPENVREG